MLKLLKRIFAPPAVKPSLPECGTLSDSMGSCLVLSRTCFDGSDWDFTIDAGGTLCGELITSGTVSCADGVMVATLNGTEVPLDSDGDASAIVAVGTFRGAQIVVAI